jgi:hypothetical protein
MEKPATFDFNDRRSDKTGRSVDWTAPDALYSAHLEVTPATAAVLIVWMDEDPDSPGSFNVRYRTAGGVANAALLAHKFLQHGI